MFAFPSIYNFRYQKNQDMVVVRLKGMGSATLVGVNCSDSIMSACDFPLQKSLNPVPVEYLYFGEYSPRVLAIPLFQLWFSHGKLGQWPRQFHWTKPPWYLFLGTQYMFSSVSSSAHAAVSLEVEGTPETVCCSCWWAWLALFLQLRSSICVGISPWIGDNLASELTVLPYTWHWRCTHLSHRCLKY